MSRIMREYSKLYYAYKASLDNFEIFTASSNTIKKIA